MTITNDGATILKEMQVLHPAAKMVRLCHLVCRVHKRGNVACAFAAIRTKAKLLLLVKKENIKYNWHPIWTDLIVVRF